MTETKKRTLIHGGSVITMNPKDEIFDKGWVLFEGDKITGIGSGDPDDLAGADEIIDAANKAVMPGIVNIHTHVCGSAYKALTEDRKGSFYSLFFPMESFMTNEYAYLLSMLGCIETVKFGSTFVNETFPFMYQTGEAVEKIGLRGTLAQQICDVDLPRLQFNDYTRIPQLGDKLLEDNIRLIEEFHNKANGRITCRFGPHATDTVSMELARKIGDMAEKYNVGLHIHVAQKDKELEYLKEAYGLSPVEYLKEVGYAGSNLIAAHCTLSSASDIQLLKKTETNLAHCPEIVLKRGVYPLIKEIYASGLKIGLGTDWLTMNPWSNMRAAIYGARSRGCDEDSSNAKKTFKMATIGAAKVAGKEDSIGSLEIGKKADIITMNLNLSHMQPIYDDIIASIVYNATGSEISTVIIDGKTIVKDGNVTTVDESAIIKEAVAAGKSMYDSHLKSAKQ